MKRPHLFRWALPALLLAVAGGCGVERQRSIDGEALFMQYCSGCHPDGGNQINPAKSLRRIDRQANGIAVARDIVARMRSPGPGMPRFDRARIPDDEAKAIADYVMKSY